MGALGLLGISAQKAWAMQVRGAQPVSSGRFLTPVGEHVGVGSFPANSILSPDGKFLITTDTGFRQSLSSVNLAKDEVIDQQEFNGRGPNGKKDELYFGLAFERDSHVLLVSRGGQGQISRYDINEQGHLRPLGEPIVVPKEDLVGPVAGIAVDERNEKAVAINGATPTGDHHGFVVFFDRDNRLVGQVQVPGYPLDVTSQFGHTFVTCERDGVVVVLNSSGVQKTIKTGADPSKLLATSKGIWVANSGSDTLSFIDRESLSVTRTIVVRPKSLRGLPIATPLDMAISSDQRTLYVALADLNAIGVVEEASGNLKGLIPTGWYPTSVKLAQKEKSLVVTSAKGILPQTPTAQKVGPEGAWGTYAPNVIEGTVSRIELPQALADLSRLTKSALANLEVAQTTKFSNPGIKHAIYIIKENRTYDQVFGDIPEGNGDPSLTLFGEAVTPNQHALAKRFLLLDNFYTCAEVSADGWNWSTSGMINEFTARNVPNNYSRRRPSYDYEGSNNGYFPDLEGLPDVARAPGGYIWDNAIQHHVSLRNYGFFVGDVEAKGAKSSQKSPTNGATKRALIPYTDTSFRQFDMQLPDSDLWTKLHVTAENQMKSYGLYGSNSRFAEWKREFDGYVKAKNLPALTLLRLPRDHTAGTSPGNWTPEAMVADNDYAVGEIVDAVSHSPFWESTAIFILEDDSQAGTDHVDCHRFPALVITPYLEKAGKDSGFYNTDSMLHTIEQLLHLPPMNSFDAFAPTFRFSKQPVNSAPYEAVMPDPKIAATLNTADAYRAADSVRLLHNLFEETKSDLELNDILWHAIKGNRPMPKARGSAFTHRDDD
jgi:DNA-binding beta-propeller fold protein YncE